MKRLLAMVLCLSMVFGLLPALAAAEAPAPTQTIGNATELPGNSRLDGVKLPQKADQSLYDEEQMVCVIVEFTDAPLLSGFTAKGTGSIGSQVSSYLTNAAPQAEALVRTQDHMVATMGKAVGGELTVLNRWTNVVNAVSLRIPYGALETLRSIQGVKSVHVERVFDRPVTTQGAAIDGTHGHSYNMTGLSEVWAAGYTGQGMLVAVLDTGLDLIYSTWGDNVTGIRRVHEAFTDDSFKSDLSDSDLRYTNASLARFLQSTQLRVTTGMNGNKIEYANNALYKNRKVPFAADYADGDLNVFPGTSDHGNHVSGTIAGYAETPEGEVLFSGVAPDAQILSMKVFPDDTDSGAPETVILNALEDAMLLGADVVNLSLGSDNGWAEDDTAANEAYRRLSEAGITMMISAGNSGDATYGNHYGENTLVSDPETGMISAPAVYDAGLGVASIENTVAAQSVLYWTDREGAEHKAAFDDPNLVAMKASLGEGSYAVIPVGGYGTYDDYYNAGFRGYYGYGEDKGVTGVALVKRGGGLSFAEKINAATNFNWSYYDSSKGYYVNECPVKAVIIYDEDPNATELIYMSVENAMLTSCFVSGVDGHAMAASAATLRVQKEDDIIASGTAGQMSSFSSWGTGPSLELKPEITAPGGNVWSALVDGTYQPADPYGSYDDYRGAYGMMSGTSMAAPHMSGIGLLIRQFVAQEYGISSRIAIDDLTEQLLVSTAVPQLDENGIFYSPRYQGAGLVNAAAAMNTPAYIGVEGKSVGKLELLDDPSRTGAYDFTFTVNSLADRDVTYHVRATLMRPATDVYEGATVATDRDTVLAELDLGSITVPAHATARFSQTVRLTTEQKAELDALFPNGTYVEGFISLTAEQEPTIGLPVLAFYGDWTAAPIFDRSVWYETPADGETLFNNPSTWGNTFVGYGSQAGFVNLGQNVFDPFFEEQGLYHTENFTISPNGDGYLDSVNDFVLYQLRDAKIVIVEVRDTDSGELYYRDYAAWQTKSLYNSSVSVAVPTSQYYFTNSVWEGKDLSGNRLPSGTNCTMTITAYGDGNYGDGIYNAGEGRVVIDFDAVAAGEIVPTFNGHVMDMTGDVLSFPITVDTVAPKLENNTVSFHVDENGRTIMTGTVYDVDGSIASVEVHPYVRRSASYNPEYFDYGIDELNPFYTNHVYDAAAKTLTFRCDVTEYAHVNESWPGESNSYDFQWDGIVFLSCGDYGLNDRTYAIEVKTGSGLQLSQKTALLNVGGSFELNVIDNSGIEGELVRESSDPDVATIDEFGKVTALAPGQATLSVRKGDQEAICIVAVREKTTVVTDFKLALDHFPGLKPNGTILVRVTDLEPANVELTETYWVINEDDPELYTGLINVSPYDGTGLVGEVYLNYTATGDPSMVVPGASGTLDVTLNGVTRSMTLSWEDLYTYQNDDDLISDLPYMEQTMYITYGETAVLSAKYANAGIHQTSDVALYTGVGYMDYSYGNSTAPAAGLKLDGPDFCMTGAEWKGRLVNEAGYALPDHIRVFNRYSDGYESEITNSWSTAYSYDKTTGEIVVYQTPYGSDTALVIRADGVVSEGAEAGTVIGGDWVKPDPVYGPFDWEIVSGTGELVPGSGTDYYGNTITNASFTPAAPGTAIIRATTKDGAMSVNFAVVTAGVLPETLTLEHKELTIPVGRTGVIAAKLDPIPTLEHHGVVKFESYNPEVATVDESGKVTALSEGYAYIRVCTDVARMLEAVCLVHVVPCAHENTTTVTIPATCTADGSVTVTCGDCGATLSVEVVKAGHHYNALVTEPTCTEAGFTTYTCTVCGECYVAEETAALGHSFESIVVAPACGKAGYTQHVCSVCGYTYADDFTAALSCPSAVFVDVHRDTWYHEAVDYVVTMGLMNGMDATHFAPEGTTTRAQAVMVLYRMAGCPAVEGELPFADVEAGAWYFDAILWACQEGITTGVSGKCFAPDAEVTRAQLVTFLHRFAAPKLPADRSVLEAYPDGAALDNYCVEAFAWAVEQGYVNGMDGKLNPNGTANRAQFAQLLLKLTK